MHDLLCLFNKYCSKICYPFAGSTAAKDAEETKSLSNKSEKGQFPLSDTQNLVQRKAAKE